MLMAATLAASNKGASWPCLNGADIVVVTDHPAFDDHPLVAALRAAGVNAEAMPATGSGPALGNAIRTGAARAVILTGEALSAPAYSEMVDAIEDLPPATNLMIIAIDADLAEATSRLAHLARHASVVRVRSPVDVRLVVDLALATLRNQRQCDAAPAIAADDASRIGYARLADADERNRVLFELSDLIQFTADAAGRLTAVDDRFYQLTGFSRDVDMSVDGDKIRLHADDRLRVRTLQAEALAGRTPLRYDYRGRVADGSYRWWQLRAVPFIDSDGVVVRWNGTLADIHDRKIAEERLRESEVRHRASIALSHLVTFVCDSDGQLVDIDDRICELTGLSMAEVLAKGPDGLCHPDDLPDFIRQRDEAVGTLDLDITHRLREASGDYRWWRTRSAPRYDDSGAFAGWFGTIEDVDRLVCAREQLRVSEERLRYSIELSDQVAWSARGDGTIESIGDTLFQRLGFERDAWLAMTAAERLHPDDIARFASMTRTATRERTAADFRFRLRCADGRYRWWRSRCSPLLGEDGRVWRWHGMLDDVDALQRAEEQLRESEERYRFSIRLSNLVTYTASPDGRIDGMDIVTAEATGLPAEAVLANGPDFTWHPDHLPDVHAARAAAAVTGEYDVTRLMGNPEVGYRWWRSRAAPFRNADGRTLRWHGTLENVDSLKRAEEKLRESEDRHRCCIELSNLITYTTSPTGEFTSIDEAIFPATGVSVVDVLDKTSASFCHPDDIEVLQQWREAAIVDGFFDHVHRLRSADGSYRWWRSRARPRRDAAGVIVRWYGTFEDIDDLRRAEEKLRLSEELHRFSLHLSDMVVWSADTKGMVVDVGDRLFEIAGVSREQMIGGNIREWLHPDEADAIIERRGRSLVDGTPADFDLRLRKADGNFHWWRWRSAPQRGASGEIVRWYGTLENIDALRRAEAQLRSSEELHRFSIELSNLIVWTGSTDGKFLTIDPSIFKRLGLTREATASMRGIDLMHPDDFSTAAEAFRAGMKHGTPADFRHRLRHADGSYRWWRLRASPLSAEDGTTQRWYGTLEDIDDLKRAEEQLRDSEELYRNTVELSNQIVLTTSGTGKLLTVADNWEAMTGYRSDEVGGGALDTRLCHPDDAPRVDAERLVAYRNLSPLDQRFRMLRPDGSYCWWRLRAAPRLDTGRGTLRWYCTLEDIDHLMQAEQRLRETEELYRYTVELGGQVVITAGIDGEITSLSPLFTAMTGIAAGQLLSDGMLAWIHPEDRDAASQRWWRRVIEGEGADHVFRLRNADGSHCWWRIRAAPRLSDDGGIISWYGTLENVDAARRAEIDLERLRAEMVHLSRLSAMGTMASTLAHELNQPLAAVLNYVGGSRRLLATSTGPEIKRIQAAMLNAEDCATRASEIIRRVRRQVSRGEPAYHDEDVGQLVADAASIALINAKALGIDVQFDLDPHAMTVHVDSIQVQQVLINLLRNAVEAVADVLVRTIVITTRLEPGFCAIAVSDSGPGIDKSMEDRLFEPFKSTKADGIGIGLSISRTIAESHRGRLHYAPSAIGGACFTVTLPTAAQ